MRRWVEFIVCLVGVAEEMGVRDPWGESWGFEGRERERGVEELFGLMGMGGKGRAYWMGRVEAFCEEGG